MDILRVLKDDHTQRINLLAGASSAARAALQGAEDACQSMGVDMSVELVGLVGRIDAAEASTDPGLLNELKYECGELESAVRSGRLGQLRLQLRGVEIMAKWSVQSDSEGQEGHFSVIIGGASAVYSSNVMAGYASVCEARTFELNRGGYRDLLFYACNGEFRDVKSAEGQVVAFFPELSRIHPAEIVLELNVRARASKMWAPFKQLWFTYAASSTPWGPAAPGAASAAVSSASANDAVVDASGVDHVPPDEHGVVQSDGNIAVRPARCSFLQRIIRNARPNILLGSSRKAEVAYFLNETASGAKGKTGASSDGAAESCPVCLEPFEDEGIRKAFVLTCCHSVCQECWNLWVAAAPGRPSCPLCRHGAPVVASSGGCCAEDLNQ
eukprot:TRINITY_DN63195_c0_g1_i1.p1 TRINITY_DN63195_c0_g1~~TRINITY_DN63195_c0_g1_i1.p1  ORF type:complete len:427 (+),score=70.55 TRINITY_DN63195_c0_g1_i1:130-1281(+)